MNYQGEFFMRHGTRALALGLLLIATPAAIAKADEPGASYQVPYKLTDTNHFLVRVRINGKGPFNFLVDTGAPALYVSTDTARKIGLTPAQDDFWTPVDRLDFEGGASLRDVKARVEDPFQLVGMNALGLPGASIDGILGFTMLARFKITLDPTSDRMTWTRLDYEPKEPPVPRRRPGDKPPAEMQAMNALGPLAKLAAVFIGKQPEVKLVPRGFLGIELENGETDASALRVAAVLAGSPAEAGGLRKGDRLVKLAGVALKTAEDARTALATVKPGDDVAVEVRRGEDSSPVTLNVHAGEGL
ncbi:MAG: PDZ domain-containing protein [Isosphaeraceae bacterium]